MQEQKNKKADVCFCALAAVLTFAVTLYFGLYGCDPHHDGVMFEAALKVAHGAVLFRDTFTQYGALAVWYDALFIKLFGDSMASIQIAAAVGMAGCGVLLYTVSKKLMGHGMALLTALLAPALSYMYFWHLHPWSSIPALFFQLLACELVMQYKQKGGWWRLALAGLCAALCAWCRLPVGLLMFIAGAAALVLVQLIRRQAAKAFLCELAVYAAGFAVQLAVLVLPMLQNGTLDAWHGMVIVGTSSFAAETNTAGASTGFLVRLVWSLAGAWIKRNPLIDWIWLALPAAVGLCLLRIGVPVLAAYAKSFTGPKVPSCPQKDVLAVVLCVYAAAGWAQYYPVSDYRHWYWSALPMLPVLGYELCGLAQKRFAKPQRAAALALAVLLAGNLGVRGYFALATAGIVQYEKDPNETRPGITRFYMDENWNRNGTSVYTNADYPYLNGLRLAPDTAAFYNELYAALNELKEKYPEKNIYNRTAEGFLGVFQTEYIPYGDAPYSEYTQKENEYIQANKPIVITQSQTDWQGYTPDYKPYAVISGNDGRVNENTIYIMVAE